MTFNFINSIINVLMMQWIWSNFRRIIPKNITSEIAKKYRKSINLSFGNWFSKCYNNVIYLTNSFTTILKTCFLILYCSKIGFLVYIKVFKSEN